MMEVTRDPFLLWFTLESLADLERLSTSSETLDLRGLASEVPFPVLIESVLAGEPSASSSQPWYRLKSALSLSSLCPFSVSWPWGGVLFECIAARCHCNHHLYWHRVPQRRVGLVHCLHLHQSVTSSSLLNTKYFIFRKLINKAHGHAGSTWDIFPVNSSIFACSFFLRWFGGNSEKSSCAMGDIPVTFWKRMKWSIFNENILWKENSSSEAKVISKWSSKLRRKRKLNQSETPDILTLRYEARIAQYEEGREAEIYRD